MPKAKIIISGRIALVTGSAGGIGKAIAKKFAEEGACMYVLNDINEERMAGRNVKSLKNNLGKM